MTKSTTNKEPAGDDVLIRRGAAAYLRTDGTPHPVIGLCSVAEHGGKLYVVLRSNDDVLAVYRVRRYDGVLRRMKRPPREVEVS